VAHSDRPIIDISVASRFHAFDLARELVKHDMLRQVHTGYPRFLGPKFGVPQKTVRSVWTGEPLNRLLSVLHRRHWIRSKPDYYIGERHDRIVASRIQPGANIFVGWSSQCRLSINVARSLGMMTIVERGSAHIEWQRDELIEEARLTGLPIDVPHARTIEHELAEYQAADYIAVPSAFAASTFVAKGVPATKLLLNPYGVDLARFSGSSRIPKELWTASDHLKVLHVGRVSAQKGVHYLIDAVQRVPGARLTLVGALDVGITAVVDGRPGVRVVGAVHGSDLPQWYREADVFCLLSVQDGFGLVIAQAMAMGLPVIASANTGGRELIDDGVHGFIVPARDPAAAAARLQQLADAPDLRREMGRRARARVTAGFGWTDYGERAASIYRKALAARNVGAGGPPTARPLGGGSMSHPTHGRSD
jgi:glycosyltransferase involved in cell wall biosynthesis